VSEVEVVVTLHPDVAATFTVAVIAAD